MKNLKFNSLAIASNSQRSANQFEFHPQFNLITGPDNSIGKTTLVKILLWSVGCDPFLDVNWTINEAQSLVNFSIENKTFTVARRGSRMVLQEQGQPAEIYESITGAYSEKFASIVGFNVLLPSRKDPAVLETPPPAFYFLPFYIDQRRGWSTAWNGLNGLMQFANWQKTTISYHTGYLDPEHFELAAQIATQLRNANDKKFEVAQITTTISVVENLAPAIKGTSAGEGLAAVIADVGKDIGFLQREIDRRLKDLTAFREEGAQVHAQISILDVAAKDLGLDYAFTVENTRGEQLQCPICGTSHDNGL